MDSKLLADVYLAMTGGQASLTLEGIKQKSKKFFFHHDSLQLRKAIYSDENVDEHYSYLKEILKLKEDSIW